MSTPLRQRLLEHMGSPSYGPQNKAELARALGIPSKERAALRALVETLVAQGDILRLKKGAYTLKTRGRDLVTGKIKTLRSGKTLFIADHPDQLAAAIGPDTPPLTELVLNPHRIMSAMDGDHVAIRIRLATPKGWRKRHKGRPSLENIDIRVRVEKILSRGRDRWIGVYRRGRNFGTVHGDGVTSPSVIELTARPDRGTRPGQIVVVQPSDYGEGKTTPRGAIVETLGWPDDKGVDIETIIRKYRLPLQYPADVLAELDRFSGPPDQNELAERENWTRQPVITIDPVGARDFDDAIHVAKQGDQWQLAVHIADVAHYVKPGSALDREARERGNSTYLPDRVIPMLPPRLSDDLCSLKAGEIRLTRLCLITFDSKGNRIATRFARAYIKNERQITYPEAYKLITGNRRDPDSDMLRQAWQLASILRQNRIKQGALDLDFPDIRVILDKNGVPENIITEEYDESHQLIEEFMLAANEAVAETLKNASKPTIYRIHEQPDEAKLNEFGELCKLYGHPVHDLSNRRNLVTLLASLKNSPDEQTLKLALLKSMMRARYDTTPLGHYGLAKTNYCHFTSPIRRYADLIVHRSLDALAGLKNTGIDSTSLQATADHISITERNSADAERDAHRLKLFEWLDNQSRSDNPRPLDALATDIRHYGIHIDIPLLQIRGLIKQTALPGRRWRYEAFADRWSNPDGRAITTGAKLTVIPANIDRAKQWADFNLREIKPRPQQR